MNKSLFYLICSINVWWVGVKYVFCILLITENLKWYSPPPIFCLKCRHFLLTRMSFQLVKLCSSSEHNLRYFGWKPRGLWLSHWLPSNENGQDPEKYETHCQDTLSGVQSDCYEATRILSVWKYNKNNDFIQQLGTVTSPLHHVVPFWRLSPGSKMHTVFNISLDTGMSLPRRFMLWTQTSVSRLIQKNTCILCSEDEQSFYGFGTTWGRW